MEMNGIISVSTPRITINAKQVTTTIVAGVCLFSGFMVGLRLPVNALFRSQTVDYSKITWIENELSKKTLAVSIGSPEHPLPAPLQVNVEFVPYVLSAEKAKSRVGAHTLTQAKNKKSNIVALQKALNALVERQRLAQKIEQAKQINLFDDYQRATETLRTEFVSAVDPIRGKSLVASVRSSFQRPIVQESASPLPPVLGAMESSKKPGFPNGEQKNNEVNAAISFTFPKKRQAKADEAPLVVESIPTEPIAEPIAEVTEVTYPVNAATHEAATRNAVVREAAEQFDHKIDQKVNTQTVASTEAVKTNLSSAEITETHFSGELTKEEKLALSDDLLNSELQQEAVLKAHKITANWTRNSNPPQSVTLAQSKIGERGPDLNEKMVDPTQTLTPIEPEVAHGFVDSSVLPEATPDSKKGDCRILDNQSFTAPSNTNLTGTGENSQICPERKEWISKNWNGRGWVKLEGSQMFNTLMFYPAPNGEPTLLLNQNAVALLAITSGVHIAKGAGIVIGTVPPGFKVDFAGRAEETQYFESSGKRYFAILNAEPGANVVELLSDKNQTLSATVFTPIIEDTITYLDLSAPISSSIPIQVVKNGTPNDPEVVGLTVGISTQSGIQGITQSDGKVLLRNVNMVRGYPIFIDVASKTGQEQSYTYRYELSELPKEGVFVVNQINEHSLYKWLHQLKQGLSDQSAMVVGFFDRKRFDGFHNHHFVSVEAMGAKLGLEPLNYSILWDGQISSSEPLEGDLPRFMSVQVPEGLSQIKLNDETNQAVYSKLIPISPRVIHVVSE